MIKCLFFAACSALVGGPLSAADLPEKNIQGFANNIPLSYVVEEVVPEQYTVLYATDVNSQALVSWSSKGEDWSDVLNRVLSVQGLKADFSNTNDIRIVRDRTVGLIRRGGVEVVPTSKPAPHTRKDTYADMILGDGGVEVVGAPISAEEAKIASVIDLANDKPEEQIITELGNDAIFVGIDPNEVAPEPEEWTVYNGATLEVILREWADRAGWSVHYLTDYDYEMTVTHTYKGDFIDVMGRLALDMEKSFRPKVRIDMKKGNNALVVTTLEEEGARK